MTEARGASPGHARLAGRRPLGGGARILVIEDDPSIRMGLEDTLTAKGYQVDAVGRGGEGADKAIGGRYDLVVLDVMLPDLDGFEVCRRIRASRGASRRVPVIMLSARGAELDRVRGLELGADDYVTKPFSLMELLARVASVLRRAGGEAAEPIGLAFGGIEIDLAGQVARRAGKRIDLPSRAFAILKVFAKRPGEVVSRDVLLDEAWGYEAYPNTRTVDNHLVKLRRALEDEPDKPRWLVTVHGAGYKLDVPRDAVQCAAGGSGAGGSGAGGSGAGGSGASGSGASGSGTGGSGIGGSAR